jgi:hypothetical protein
MAASLSSPSLSASRSRYARRSFRTPFPHNGKAVMGNNKALQVGAESLSAAIGGALAGILILLPLVPSAFCWLERASCSLSTRLHVRQLPNASQPLANLTCKAQNNSAIGWYLSPGMRGQFVGWTRCHSCLDGRLSHTIQTGAVTLAGAHEAAGRNRRSRTR